MNQNINTTTTSQPYGYRLTTNVTLYAYNDSTSVVFYNVNIEI